MKENFLKMHTVHIKGITDSNLNDVDKKIIELEKNGGMYIYKLIFRRIVRQHWNDHDGFPVKKEFYNKHFLACSISVRKLCRESGFSDQKVQKILKQLEEIDWIVKDNKHIKKKQTAFILGTWTIKKALIENKLVDKYYENIYSTIIQNNNQLINTESIEKKLNRIDYSELDLYMKI